MEVAERVLVATAMETAEREAVDVYIAIIERL